jgi:hypothetical protein
MAVVADRMGVDGGIDAFRFGLLQRGGQHLVAAAALLEVAGQNILQAVGAGEGLAQSAGAAVSPGLST